MLVRTDNLVFPGVHEETGILALRAESDVHLNTHLPHHDRRLRFVLVCLDHSLVSLSVLLKPLISLCEGVVVDVASLVVTEASEVRFWALCLLNFDIDALDLFEVS